MTEAFLQYVWQHQLICLDKLYTIDNEKITVIKTGTFNTNAGPDFLNAKIKIGDTVWAGDVEIHIKSSDWYVHKHHTQQSYNSVILHVVATCDKKVLSEKGMNIPTLVIPILPHISLNYKNLSNISSDIRCSSHLRNIDSFKITMYLERLTAERFEEKAMYIKNLFHENTNDWDETCYQLLAKNLGFKVNSDGFELLAKSLPLRIIKKHTDNLFQIEALLFGQANLLNNNSSEEYEKSLFKEYCFLQKKYNLTPISSTWWKFARMRPYNFPTIKISQLANILFSINYLTTFIVEAKSIKKVSNLFNCQTDSFWETHYSFNKQSPKHTTYLGKQAIETLLINTIIPFLYTYGKEHNNEELKQRAYDFLISIKQENNSIVTKWKESGIKISNAFDTQGLLQLYNCYCKKGLCTRCSIGHIVLNRKSQ
ncbi:MAG: DUF2851 family protein [Bacteroidales bacterium]|nr:DUF2851 family protein [Bacteroidales bacterium]